MKTVIIQKQLLIELKTAIKEYNIVNKPKLVIDVSVYFLSLFNSIPSQYREEDEEEEDGVSLDSQLLKQHHGKYNQYLEFLKEHFIDKVSNYGADIKRCSIFKMKNKYLNDEVETYKITNKLLLKKFDQQGLTPLQKDKNQCCIKTRPHLVKFFDDKLTIDSKAAYDEIKPFITSRDTRRKYITNATLISEFFYKEWKYSIKKKSDNRLHSNITRSSKLLRKHIQYDGKPITGNDLKTSHSFFFCVIIKAILNKDKALLEQNKATDILNDSVIESLFNLELNRQELISFARSVLDKDFYTEFQHKLNIDFDEDGKPFRMVSNYTRKKKYRSRSKQGEIKEPKRKVTYKTPRELVKAVVMEIFYSKPRTTIKEAKIFRETYPSVSRIFKCFDDHDVKFSYLLQYIEAYVLLDYTAKKINQSHPNMPLFSIHDALVTNEDWQHILEVEMRDHIKRITTIPPNIDVENWK
jgi:hypothetical protein